MTELLGNLCRFVTGGTPSKSEARFFDGHIPWITSADITQAVASTARSFITEEAVSASATNRVAAGTVLLVTRTGVGKVAVAGCDLCFSQDITALIPDSARLDAAYLVHFLRTKQDYFLSMARGATIKGVTRDVVSNIEIALPSLDEQRRIAAILDKADALRTKRREALAQLDRLTQSIFVEMFGDPVSNSYGWPRLALRDLLSGIDSGWSPVCLDRPAETGEWGVLKLGAVTSCVYDQQANKALPQGVEPVPSIEVKPGDLLFSRKNTYELVAACALVETTRPRLMMSDLIFRLQVRDEAGLNKTFLHALLTNPRKRAEVQKLAGGSAGSMPNISKAKLLEMEVEVPPIALQQDFASRVGKARRIRASNEVAAAEADSLFVSLRQRAFQGEL